MPNVNAVINEQIRRLARREIRTNTKAVKKATSAYRHAIAELRKRVAELTKRLASVERRKPEAGGAGGSGGNGGMMEAGDNSRFRAVGVKAHRAKLGLSAKEYGRLVGVSALTVYHWEQGKSRPRNKATAAKWLAIRGLGKKEAYERLGMKEPAGAGAGRGGPGRRRGKFKQTGEQTILSLLKGKKGMATREINDAWRKEGRAGSADVMLGLLVKAKKLKRTKVEGIRGSQYSVA
jgi:DNA-binding XRE family transcriptional regulator